MAELLIGAALGFLAGLGLGGGSLLLLWLTAVRGLSGEEAGAVNLLFFLPAAFIASLFRLKQGVLDLKKVLPALAAGIPATWAATKWASALPENALSLPFGLLLLAAGLRELFYRPRKAR